jgi:hypothetical protein
MKKRYFLLIAGVFLCAVTFIVKPAVHASLIETDKLTVAGFLKNATAVNLDDIDEFYKIRSTIQVEAEYRLTENIHLFTILRGWYDSVYDAESKWRKNKNRKHLSRNRGTEWLRECYIDFYSEHLDIRIGRQQVVWGTADGVKILDIVNPIDMREFNLELTRALDVDVKIPLWMMKLEYSPTVNGTLQFLFIPDFESNFFAPAYAPYAVRAKNMGEQRLDTLRNMGADVVIKRKKPGQSLENSSIGVRWLDVIGGFEYTLNYLHGYSNSMARHFMGIDPIGIPFFPGSVANFEDRYAQTETFGASFSKAINKGFLRGLNIRGEFAYVKNFDNGYGTKDNQVGVGEVDQYNYVLGFDKYFWTNWLFSFQFIQFSLEREKDSGYHYLFGPTSDVLDQHETILSLSVSTDFMHERLKPNLRVFWGDDNDWETNLRLEYELRDYLILYWGLNLFHGHSSQLFGQFRDRDTMYFEVKFGF